MSSIDSGARSLGDPFGDGAYGVGHHPGAPDAAASASAAAAEAARLGVAAPGAPNGRVLPCDLGALDEDALLGPGRTARLYAVADRPEDFRPEREPLILVHGIKGDPRDMQPIVDRLRGDDRFQVYVLCYDDYHRRTGRNGVDLASELRALSQGTLGAGRPVSIVAHSMGGIVARRALNELTVDSQRSIDRFSQVRLIAADTPWHGFPGPADDGLGSIAMAFARPFMPDGLEDMRAESALFRGNPGASGAAARAGLYGVDLPAHVRTDVVFAERGDQALDYTEPPLSRLPGLIAANLRDEVRNPIRGEPRLENHWRALVQSSRFPAFRIDLERCLREGRLDESAVRSALERHFPRFPGSHAGVLGAPGSASAPSFLDHLEGLLAPPPA